MDSFYSSLLKRSEWIKKRDRIFKRDGYKCTTCGSKSRLCVHHTYYYEKMVAPWEYPNDSLLTLCNKCHKKYHETHELVFITNPEVKKIRKGTISYKVDNKGGDKKKKKKRRCIDIEDLEKELNRKCYRRRSVEK